MVDYAAREGDSAIGLLWAATAIEHGLLGQASDPTRASVLLQRALKLAQQDDTSAVTFAANLFCDVSQAAGLSLLQRMAAAFAFPPGFGLNWDSLADALSDLSWLPAEGYVLGLESPGDLREDCPEDFATFVAVLEGASLAWRDAGRPFWSFIALPDDEFEALAP